MGGWCRTKRSADALLSGCMIYMQRSSGRMLMFSQNEFFKYHLQRDVMYTMLKERIVEPNAQKIIEGDTLLERAQNAMNALRRKEASGERLVWRVVDN